MILIFLKNQKNKLPINQFNYLLGERNNPLSVEKDKKTDITHLKYITLEKFILKSIFKSVCAIVLHKVYCINLEFTNGQGISILGTKTGGKRMVAWYCHNEL